MDSVFYDRVARGRRRERGESVVRTMGQEVMLLRKGEAALSPVERKGSERFYKNLGTYSYTTYYWWLNGGAS